MQTWLVQNRVRRAFTMVELLVIVAIIAVLAALLFPVIARARESHRNSIDLSDQKQMETSMGLYVQDFDEKAPLDPAPHYMPPVGVASYYTRVARRRFAVCASNLINHGGTGGISVETAPKIYLVFWGSQWNNNDPSGEAAILRAFYSGVGGSAWNNSVIQYTQPDNVTHGGNPTGMFAGYWYDNTSSAPKHPTQSQLAAEAVRAAAHFGNTTAASNASVQYVIATSHGNSASGFGTSYCAWHSGTSGAYGNIAYTNLPYITDAGASCGANFNGLGATAGITIVGGHEMAETETDQFPSTGWLDSAGAENGDKCAWISSGQGASTTVTLSTGVFPVQSLWSNAFNGGSGGCVLSYP